MFSSFSDSCLDSLLKAIARLLTIGFCLGIWLPSGAAQNRFVHVPSYSAGGISPTLLAQHDVDGDGNLDLIVMNMNAKTKLETVSLLLGTGTGGYLAPTEHRII